MAAESQNNLTIVLNQQDDLGVNILNRTLGAFAYAGTVGNYFIGTLVGTGVVAFTLPTTNVHQVLVVNTHATAVYTVIGTPQGGASATLGKVLADGMFVYWGIASGASGGYTAVSLTSDTATGSTFSAFLGG